MRRSDKKILTTHVGSLPDPADMSPPLEARVAEVVRRQREAGLDLINEGEYTEGRRLAVLHGRPLRRLTERAAGGGAPMITQGKDREEFAEFYRYATEHGTLFYYRRPDRADADAAAALGVHRADRLPGPGGARSARSTVARRTSAPRTRS